MKYRLTATATYENGIKAHIDQIHYSLTAVALELKRLEKAIEVKDLKIEEEA